MKICKRIIGLFILCFLTGSNAAQGADNPDVIFLQEIQDRMRRVSGLKDRGVTLKITPDQKRITHITPSSVSYSYGFLKQMENINQLIATMAHMSAHISLDYVETPPPPEKAAHGDKNTSTLKDYISSALRPEYPNENYLPQATGPLYKKGAQVFERPSYQNRNYDYEINKKDIIEAEQEREADRAALKIMKQSGFCPADYNHMLRYFYEHPQKLLGNKHFALESDQWQRLDMIDRLTGPGQPCNIDQKSLAKKYAPSFDHLKVRVIQALKARRPNSSFPQGALPVHR